MFNSENEQRKMALSIVHYIYRNNDVIENNHSLGITMNMDFYKKVYKVVYANVCRVKKFQKFISDFCVDDGMNNLDELINSVPENEKFKFMNYFKFVISNIKDQFGSGWEQAQLIDVDLKGKSLANFILSGNFLDCCKNGRILDDEAMCYINKDINNRVYSLLVKGYFD